MEKPRFGGAFAVGQCFYMAAFLGCRRENHRNFGEKAGVFEGKHEFYPLRRGF